LAAFLEAFERLPAVDAVECDDGFVVATAVVAVCRRQLM